MKDYVIQRMTQVPSEKELLVFPIGVEPTTVCYYGCSATELQETRDKLSRLTKSKVTNFLNTAWIGISTFEAW